MVKIIDASELDIGSATTYIELFKKNGIDLSNFEWAIVLKLPPGIHIVYKNYEDGCEMWSRALVNNDGYFNTTTEVKKVPERVMQLYRLMRL